MTATNAPALAAPFRGLAPFGDSELDALLFFGRERETEIAVANLLAARLTILYGPSGVGKSSLLNAGAARRVRELGGRRAIGRGPDSAAIVFSSWADDPVAGLSRAIADEVTGLVERPVPHPPPDTSLADVIEHWAAVLDGSLYLVLDQFEEYFVYAEAGGPRSLESELPEVILRPRLRANVLLSLRDDSLAQLDVFKARLPGLFANYLRLDRLDRAAATAAIRGPVGLWNTLVPAEQRMEIEPSLVAAVLDEATPAGEPDRIEAPYLQLVLERLWDEERAHGSSVLRSSTLAALGGAGAIVRDHLDRALAVLDSSEQDAAARMFEHLVTPSGTKVAHTAGDLAQFADVPAAEAAAMLAALGRERILRPLDDVGGAGDRYEIFHDVLGEAILGWRRGYLLLRERARAHRRQRRLVAIALASLAAVLVMVGVTIYALSQRSHARHQTQLALAATRTARAAQRRATHNAQEAIRQTTLAKQRLRSEQRAEAAAKHARHKAQVAQFAASRERDHVKATNKLLSQKTVEATAAKNDALAAERQATRNLRSAKHEAKRANQNLAAADAATAGAHRQTTIAEQQATIAKQQRRIAEQQTTIATARANLSQAQAELDVDPAQSVRYALKAAATLPRDSVPLLRDSLVRLHELRVVGGAGAPVGSLAIAGDGSRMVVAGASGVAVRDAHTGALLHELQLPTGTSGAALAGRTGGLVAGLRPSGGVGTVAISGNGAFVAGATRSGAVEVWDARTGALLHTLPEPSRVDALAFSADGALVATGGLDQVAKVWDVATGELRERFSQPRAVDSVVFSPDGSELLTTEGDRYARLFLLGQPGASVVLDQIGGVTSAAFSGDGSRIVTTGRNDTATVWDGRTGLRRHVLSGHFSDVTDAAFSHSGTLLATASTDNTARVWDVESGISVATMSGDTGIIESVSWSPDDRFVVTASTDGSARVWESSDGFERAKLLGHVGAVRSAAYVGPDTVVTSGVDGTARIWNPNDQPLLRLVGTHKGRVVSVAFALDGSRIVSAGADGTAAIWPASGRGQTHDLVHAGPVSGLRVSGDGRKVLTWSSDGTAALWAVPTGRRLLTFPHGAPVVAAALSTDGSLAATAGADNSVRLWDALTGGLIRTIPETGADAVAFSPDSHLLATGGSGRTVHVWRVPVGPSVAAPVEPAGVSALVFAPDGASLAASAGDVATVWDTGTSWRQSFSFDHANRVTSLAFTRNGGRLLSGSADGTAQLWDVRTRRRVEELRGHFGPVSQAVLSADGRWVVTAGPLTAGVWPTDEDPRLPDNRLFFLRGNTKQVLSVAASPSGWQFATGDVDGSVRVYDCVVCGTLAQLEPLARHALADLRPER